MSAGEERGGGYWPEGEESLDGGGGGTLGRGKETKRKRAPSSSQATRLPRDGARARQVARGAPRGRSDRFPALFFPARRVPVDVAVETAVVPAAARLKRETVPRRLVRERCFSLSWAGGSCPPRRLGRR